MGFSRQEYWSGVPLPSPKAWMVAAKFYVNSCQQRGLEGLVSISVSQTGMRGAGTTGIWQKKKKKKSWDKIYKAAWDLGQGCVVKESNFLASEELREASVWMSLDKLASAEEKVPLLLGISHSLERSWHHKVLMFTACCCWCTKHSSVQSLSHVRLCATPWTAACQDSLSFTISGVCSNSCLQSQ